MAQQKKKSSSSGGRIAVCIALIVLALLVLACAGGVMAVAEITTVYPNVRLDGRDIGELTDVQLLNVLLASGYEDVGDAEVSVTLPLEHQLTVRAEQVCSKTTAAQIVESVMSACHQGSRLDKTLRYLNCRFGAGMDLSSGSVMSVDASAVRALVDQAVREVELDLMSSDVTITEEAILVRKGATAVTVDAEELSALIVQAFDRGEFTPLVYDGHIREDSELDLQSLYDRVFCEPVDAYYDPELDEVVPETVGLSFDMAEAQRLWNAAVYGEQVAIPLLATLPAMPEEELSALLFRDNFCTIPTSLWGSSASRINNVTKAAEAINGLVLMPGDEFSYNEALGERTAENGYLPAGAYSDGQTVQEYGGGICQVSSAVYYCALHANLKITSRTCHYFPVGYLPAGLDATVSWGGPEFKFVNNREYPVKLVAYVKDHQAVVEIWGTDVDGSYVEMTYATELVYDKEHTEVAVGYKAETHRLVYDKNGTLLSRSKEANSYYHYHDEDIEWPEETPTPDPEASPEVTPEESPELGPELTPGPEATPEATPPVEPEETVPPAPEESPDPDPDDPESTPDPETTPDIPHEPWVGEGESGGEDETENSGIGL